MNSKTVKTDVAVLGGGPGGTAAALTAAAAGLKCVIVDSGEPGGTCLNRGCVPAKSWLAVEHHYRMTKWAEGLGGATAKMYDFEKMKRHQEKVVELGRKGLDSVFRKKGVEWLRGSGAFSSSRSLSVNDAEICVEFKQAVIATGSRPIEIFGQKENFFSTDTIFDINKLPSSVAIIGGGASGMEMATFFSGMGCGVTVIEALTDVLPTEDDDTTAIVKRELKKSGVLIKTGTKVISAENRSGGCVIETDSGELVAETMLTAVGRMPNTKTLSLDKAGVRADIKGFIEVDGSMATTQDGIYAIGDVAGKSLLAYTAHHEGIVAARNITGKPAHMDYRFVPSIIFTNPEAASVGYTESELKQVGRPYRAGKYFVRALARAQACGEIAGLVKLLVGEDDAILGIHIAAPHATELIHSGLMAIQSGMTAHRLADSVYGHPTFSEAIPLAAADALGISIYS
ncbi:MAG: dihydrolipoyl dehydrogenase [Nitrospinota bacterium]